MRILITGGFGFLGGRLAQHLQLAGHNVLLGSRKIELMPDWLPQTGVVLTNWNDGFSLEHICQNVDIVIHTAGMNAADCAADPVAALECNGVFTTRLVRAAGSAKVKRFIYLSTAHVYASPLTGVITEKICPRNLHPYATSHLAGENAVLSASDRGEIEGIVLRLSNAFGMPGHREVNCWMLLVNDLCRQAVQTKMLVLHSNGLQQRDFISIAEVCNVAEQLVLYDGKLIQTPVFNVGGEMSQSVFEMALLIQQRCVQVLGFRPFFEKNEGIDFVKQATLKYRNDNLALQGIKYKRIDNATEIDKLLQYCHLTFTKI